jgi:hypothetical protein
MLQIFGTCLKLCGDESVVRDNATLQKSGARSEVRIPGVVGVETAPDAAHRRLYDERRDVSSTQLFVCD